ncbi:hypothetical protein AVEN_187185-1 [Araneus ventricosus]|uniref:Uncharacterized protein n=1 Tax=Araneus ventricosus TaxID=182803 RepID=A0A4Y2RLM7_ARAVE|nr:hypothetical protein AVEN_187185-1 [Araneus ventricosus]
MKLFSQRGRLHSEEDWNVKRCQRRVSSLCCFRSSLSYRRETMNNPAEEEAASLWSHRKYIRCGTRMENIGRQSLTADLLWKYCSGIYTCIRGVKGVELYILFSSADPRADDVRLRLLTVKHRKSVCNRRLSTRFCTVIRTFMK